MRVFNDWMSQKKFITFEIHSIKSVAWIEVYQYSFLDSQQIEFFFVIVSLSYETTKYFTSND